MRLVKVGIPLSVILVLGFCLVPAQTVDMLVGKFVAMAPFLRDEVKVGDRKEQREDDRRNSDASFSSVDVARAKKQVLAHRQAEMSTVENAPAGEQDTPRLQWWYLIEFVSGGEMLTNQAEIGKDSITVIDEQGVEMVIPESEIKEIKQFLR